MAKKNVSFIGKTIKAVRPMTAYEISEEGWDSGGMAIVLSDGTRLFASCDEEGNGPGAMFGVDAGGEQFLLHKA